MPIDTDSEAWAKGKKRESVTADVLEFLSAQPEQAFTGPEISDEVMDTDFEEIGENWELLDLEEAGEIEWDEYKENKNDVSVSANFRTLTYLQSRIRKLTEEELVEIRSVDASETEAIFQEGEMAYYTYALE